MKMKDPDLGFSLYDGRSHGFLCNPSLFVADPCLVVHHPVAILWQSLLFGVGVH